jgi:hypothetical protein
MVHDLGIGLHRRIGVEIAGAKRAQPRRVITRAGIENAVIPIRMLN